MIPALLCLAAYGFGSVPFGVILGALKGTDLRKTGSGNVGAANAFRNLGWGAGLLVLTGDIGKSFAAMVLAKAVLGGAAVPLDYIGIGLCAILGHNYSCFLKFRGGKGVASTLGVFLFLSWKAVLAAAGIWLLVAAVTGFASLGSLSAALLLVVFMKSFGAPRPYVIFSLAVFLLIVFKHRQNIGRLLQGKENKFKKTK